MIGTGFAGKYNFVSPEQLGMFGGDVKGQSDIYSLGLVLVAALRGEPIDMAGSQSDVIEKRRNVPDLTGIDPSIAPLIARMLEPDPARRIQTMAEVAEACLPVKPATLPPKAGRAGAKTELAPKKTDWSRPGEQKPQRKFPVALVVGLVAGLAVVGAGGFFLLSPPAPVEHGSGKGALPTLDEAPVAPNPSAQTPADEARPKAPETPSAPAADNKPAAPAPAEKPKTDADAAKIERIRKFISTYDGGDCFWINPTLVAANSAIIEGVAASKQPFEQLDAAFTKALGFDADIEFKTVNPSQCAAVSFLGRTRFDPLLAPRIDVNVTDLANGETLTGAIATHFAVELEVLLVGEDGFVQNVTSMLRAANQRAFSIRIDRPAGASAKPQLLIAIASTKPIPGLKLAKPTHADRFFPAIVADALDRGIGLEVTMKYINVQ